jgi:CheY-like chemotaxis protein
MPPSHSTYPPTREATLFIVDDDDIDVMALKRALSKLRIANPVIRARDGQEAMEMLRADQVPAPYIILLDLNMPRMGGLEFLQTIRADAALTHSVIFVLTTSRADEDLISAYRAHIAGYLLKDQMEERFLEVIQLIENYWRVVELPLRVAPPSQESKV